MPARYLSFNSSLSGIDPSSGVTFVCNMCDLVARAYKCARIVKHIYETPCSQQDRHIELVRRVRGLSSPSSCYHSVECIQLRCWQLQIPPSVACRARPSHGRAKGSAPPCRSCPFRGPVERQRRRECRCQYGYVAAESCTFLDGEQIKDILDPANKNRSRTA